MLNEKYIIVFAGIPWHAEKGKMMTLKEIAQKAGISVSTVSRIVNSANDNFARKEVRDKVWAIVKEFGYVPNQSARDLKRGSRGKSLSGVKTLTCILGRTKSTDYNPFFSQVARSVEQQALEMGHVVTISYSIFDIQNRALLQQIESSKTDGAIILGRLDQDFFNFFNRRYKNIVYIGRNLVDTDWDQVVCDGYEATKAAINYLANNGHQRIAYIGETKNEIRYQAYLDSVADLALDVDPSLTASSPQNGDGGYSGASHLLEHAKPLPTAVFCATDVTAIAAMKRFAENDIAVPGQISVMGMDDIELAGYVSPMLTTIGIPQAELGKTAVRTLIDRINKVHTIPRKIFIPYKLILRESVASGNIVDVGSFI